MTEAMPRNEEKKLPTISGTFAGLRREIDHLIDDFERRSWHLPSARSLFHGEPFWHGGRGWGKAPAVDIVDTATAYEITAELPGMDEKNVEVKFANGLLTIKGEKKEEKEENRKNYHLSERHYGVFERSFTVPDHVDASKIEATFKNGVLTVHLPKSPEAQKAEKQIVIKKA